MHHRTHTHKPGWGFIASAGLIGFLAVALGAIGAHALKPHLSESAQTLFRTAWEYQIIHALALGMGGMLTLQYPAVRSFRWAAMAWLTGTLLFSGSLYAVSLGAPHALVHITPLGGFSLMAGWIFLGLGARGIRKNN